MKTAIAALCVVALLALPLTADACSYGAGFGYGSFNSYYAAPAAAYFQVVPPVQAQLAVAQPVQAATTQQTTTTTTTTSFTPPAPALAPAYTQGYAAQSYSVPLSAIIQYQLPLYAPVQPYFANYGFSGHGYGGHGRGFGNRRY